MEEEVLKGKTLLVVDDESDLREIVSSELEFMGARVFQAENVPRAKKVLEEESIDLLVSDIRMPGGTGIDLLEHVRAISVEGPPILLITGFADIAVEDAFDKGAEGLMNKPFKLDDLIKNVERFSRPIEKRFQDDGPIPTRKIEVDFKTSLQQSLDSKECAFGRGGVCFIFENGQKKNDINERVSFTLNFTDRVLEGIGVPRWVKHPENMTGIMLGLEFIGLKGETLEYFLKHCHEAPPCTAYIPKL